MQIGTAKLSVGQLISWGVLYYTFGTAMPYMLAASNWSQLQLSAGFGIALFISGATAPLVGRFADRKGTRTLMLFGVLVGSIGLLLWANSSTFSLYIFSWILIGIAMATTLYEVAFLTAIQTNPTNSKQSIVTITLVGALASTIFMPISNALFERYGWQTGVLILTLLFAGSLTPLYASLPSNRAVQKKRPIKEARPPINSNLWILGLTFMLCGIISVAMSTYGVLYFIEKGLTTGTAVSVLSLAGIAKLFGRSVLSINLDWSYVKILQLSLLFQSIALATPIIWPSKISLLVMVLVFGATSGARTILKPLIVLELFGENDFGMKSGFLSAATTLTKSGTPIIFGVIIAGIGFDLTWFLLAAIAGFSGAVLSLVRSSS